MDLSGLDQPEDWREVRSYIQNSPLWGKFIYKRKLDSTSNYIRSNPKITVGAVVLAEEQSRGRGKGVRKWHSPRGGLWFSASVMAVTESLRQNLYVRILRAIANSLSEYGIQAAISHPNDLIVNEKKIGGILIEEYGEGLIVGVGVNVNNDLDKLPGNVSSNSTSIKEQMGREIGRDHLLTRILNNLEKAYVQVKPEIHNTGGVK